MTRAISVRMFREYQAQLVPLPKGVNSRPSILRPKADGAYRRSGIFPRLLVSTEPQTYVWFGQKLLLR